MKNRRIKASLKRLKSFIRLDAPVQLIDDEYALLRKLLVEKKEKVK